MELRFVSPRLRNLDEVGGEILVCGFFEDERPFRGVMGLLDWRLTSWLSHKAQAGLLTGEEGEVTLVPGRPRLPFEKLVLLGLGLSAEFSYDSHQRAVQSILDLLAGLRVRQAVVERPGQHLGKLEPTACVDTMLDLAATRSEHGTWTLVESSMAQRVIGDHLTEKRRRQRVR